MKQTFIFMTLGILLVAGGGCTNHNQIQRPNDWDSAKGILVEVYGSQNRILDCLMQLSDDKINDGSVRSKKEKIITEANLSRKKLIVVAEYLDDEINGEVFAYLIRKLAEDQILIIEATKDNDFEGSQQPARRCVHTLRGRLFPDQHLSPK